MHLLAGSRADSTAESSLHGLAPSALTPDVPWLTLAQIMALVDKRLRWCGLDGWRIRDTVCNAGATVTVMLRGSDRATLAITLGRDGRVHHMSLTQDPPAAPVPRPVAGHQSRGLCTRAITARTPAPRIS